MTMNPSSTHLPSLTPSVLYHGIFRSYLSCMLVEDESDHSPRLPLKPFCVITATDTTPLSIFLSSITIRPLHSAIIHRSHPKMFLLFKSIIIYFPL